MNEQLQKALADILSGVTSSLNTAKDFLLAETPEVIQQLLLWKFWEAIFEVFVGGIIVGVTVFAVCRFAKHLTLSFQANRDYLRTNDRNEELAAKAREDYHDVRVIGFGALGGVGSLLSLFGGIPSLYCSTKTALQIWLAPKLYLIEFSASLVKEVAK